MSRAGGSSSGAALAVGAALGLGAAAAAALAVALLSSQKSSKCAHSSEEADAGFISTAVIHRLVKWDCFRQGPSFTCMCERTPLLLAGLSP